jgi:hypothetical protein
MDGLKISMNGPCDLDSMSEPEIIELNKALIQKMQEGHDAWLETLDPGQRAKAEEFDRRYGV